MSVRLLSLLLLATLGTPLAAQAGQQDPDTKPAGKPAGKVAAAPAGKVDFEKQIWPILEKRCIECHSTAKAGPDGRMKKPKGGVVLDTKDGITSSKKGKLVVAKHPDDSLMYKSTTLPADDEDRMPPAKKGEPLAKEQTDLIKQWITEGGEFGAWTGKAAETTEKQKGDAPQGKPGEKAGETPTDKPKDPPKGKG